MQISPFGASSLTRHSTRISAHSGGYSRAYHVVSIPTVMARPKQRGVLGLHIHTEQLYQERSHVPQTGCWPPRVRRFRGNAHPGAGDAGNFPSCRIGLSPWQGCRSRVTRGEDDRREPRAGRFGCRRDRSTFRLAPGLGCRLLDHRTPGAASRARSTRTSRTWIQMITERTAGAVLHED
jgi:hypothetical protein